MIDYKVTRIDVNNDVFHFALFVDCNLTTFENVFKEENAGKL